LHLKVLVALGLAKIRRVASMPELEETSRANTELDELRAIIVNRMHVLRHYTLNVTLPVLRREVESLGDKEVESASVK
jgi:stearoyl-CoA desaturase (delta-9 desaturase)